MHDAKSFHKRKRYPNYNITIYMYIKSVECKLDVHKNILAECNCTEKNIFFFWPHLSLMSSKAPDMHHLINQSPNFPLTSKFCFQ